MWARAIFGLFGLIGLTFLTAQLTLAPAEDPALYADLNQDYDVRLMRDRFGVPHIYGPRDVDVAFGLAVAHAEDDFPTIADVVLAVRGVRAAHHGSAAATGDFFVQWMGVWDTVEEKYDEGVSVEAQAIAQAYADGLNWYAATSDDAIPRMLLPFTPRDVIAGMTFKMPLFYGLDSTVQQVVAGSYPGQQPAPTADSRGSIQASVPTQPTQGEPASGAKRASIAGGPVALSAPIVPTSVPTSEPTFEPGATMHALGSAMGSQGVALAPFRSPDGVTRLLANSHQPMTGAVAWYQARMKSEEGIDIVGGTFPGAPLILHGVADSHGWASTVNRPDLVDVYELVVDPQDPSRYRLDGRWVAFEEKTAHITVKFLGPLRWTFERTFKKSQHGPVMETEDGRHFAFRWAGMHAVGGMDYYLGLNKAKSQAAFEAVLARNLAPSINQIYADRAGNIAHYYVMMAPARGDVEGGSMGAETVDWQGVLPGDRSDLIWQSYRSFRELPRTVNPPSGVVFNANNTPYLSTTGEGAPRPADFPDSMGVETKLSNRSLRLARLFSGDQNIDFQALRAVKYDSYYDADFPPLIALRAYLSAPMPDEVAGDPLLRRAFEVLRGWDGSTDAESRHAALGILTIRESVEARDARTRLDPSVQTARLKKAADHLMRFFGRLDPFWGDVMRHVRGDQSWPLSGGPDVLRAIYGYPPSADGTLQATAGDGLILFAEWDAIGLVHAFSVHQFGSATARESSPHFGDQAPLFAAQQERRIPWSLEEIEAQKISDRRL